MSRRNSGYFVSHPVKLITYTRQLKLAELREARINIRQDRV